MYLLISFLGSRFFIVCSKLFSSKESHFGMIMEDKRSRREIKASLEF